MFALVFCCICSSTPLNSQPSLSSLLLHQPSCAFVGHSVTLFIQVFHAIQYFWGLLPMVEFHPNFNSYIRPSMLFFLFLTCFLHKKLSNLVCTPVFLDKPSYLMINADKTHIHALIIFEKRNCIF